MSYTPENSAVKVPAGSDLEKAIAAAPNAEVIISLLHNAAVAQHLCVPDLYDEHLLHAVEPGSAAAAHNLAKVVTINGQKHTLEAATETELLAKENTLLRETFSTQPAAATEQPRDAAGKFVSAADQAQLTDAEQAEVFHRTELDLKFKRGEISAKTYIEQSGAVSEYLSERGIDESALQEVSSQKFARSWESAAGEFKERHPEWLGGGANRDLLGQLILDNGLTESDPLEALEAVYDYAVKNNLLVENPQVTAQKSYEEAIAGAKSSSEVEEINHRFFGGRMNGSQLFDR